MGERGFDSLMTPTGLALIFVAMLIIAAFIGAGGIYMRAAIRDAKLREKSDEN
ncbi:MAG: hypothetical protein ACOYON_14585 [Fimbriimonas sp.]